MFIYPVYLSSFTTKTKSSTYACPQNYPFQCSSFEGPTLTFLVVETAQKKSGPHANLDFHLWPHPLSSLILDSLSPLCHQLCIWLAFTSPPPWSAWCKIQLLTSLWGFYLSSLTPWVLEQPSEQQPLQLHLAQPFCSDKSPTGSPSPSVLFWRWGQESTWNRAWKVIVQFSNYLFYKLCTMYTLFLILTILPGCEWLFLRFLRLPSKYS